MAIFEAVVKESDVLTAENVTMTYYATANSGSVGDIGKAWMPLEGGKDTLTYPAISAGEQLIRISWPGNQQYAATTIETTVTVNDRDALQFNLKEGPYEVGMAFDADQGYDYAEIAQQIYNTVVASTSPIQIDPQEVTVEYNADPTGALDRYKPLDYDATPVVERGFGIGTYKIRLSWPGNVEYRGNEVVVEVTTTDSRLASSVVLKDGISFTYNMDANVMKQAILDSCIDWENSVLPTRDSLSLDDFVFEYYATAQTSSVGEIGQLLDVINKLPSVVDGLRISFGSPNRAGLYTVAAITANPNYETGVGVGFLLVKMRLSGAHLTWNQEIPGGKLTAEQAKDFDFGMTLSYNGVPTADQSSVHFLYSGITNKFRIYSSTTTSPTEPGSYIVTACVLGGNYLAAPITRTFQITK